MKFEFQIEQNEQMIHGKIEADSEEIATEMVKNGEYIDEDVISREPYNKHDSYFAICQKELRQDQPVMISFSL